MAIYPVVLQHAYVNQGMFENPKFAALVASGVLETQTFSEAYPDMNGIKPGAILNIPQFSSPPDFARVDLSSGGDASFTAIDAFNQAFPVLRDASNMSWNRYDTLRTGEDFKGSFERLIGNKMARRALQVLGKVLSGSASKVSPTHVADFTGKTLTVQKLLGAKALLGDQSENLNVLVAHSRVVNDLIGDIVTNQKYNVLTGSVIIDGNIKRVLGIDYIIPTDYMPVTSAGATTAGDDVYESFLLRGNVADGTAPALFLGWQDQLVSEYFELPTKEVSQRYIRAYMDYVLSPRGFTWGGASNPTDAALATASNWTSSTEDHRNVGFVQLKTAGFGGGVVVS